MRELFRAWIHRHFAVFLSFVFGVTFGLSIVALAYFSNRSMVAADVLRYGAHVTGHADIDEDLVWFLCGIIVGSVVICVAWWRDVRRNRRD